MRVAVVCCLHMSLRIQSLTWDSFSKMSFDFVSIKPDPLTGGHDILKAHSMSVYKIIGYQEEVTLHT